jgi:LPS-assembly protein
MRPLRLRDMDPKMLKNSPFTKIFFFLLLLVFLQPLAVYAAKTPPSIAQQLGWVKEKNSCNLCGGYYKELPIIYRANPYLTSQEDNYNIDADQTTIPLKKGTLIGKGNVKVTQPNQQLTADLVHAHRDKKTGKFKKIDVYGHVRMREPEKLILAKEAHMNLDTKLTTLKKVHYRLARSEAKMITVKNPKTGKIEHRLYQSNAIGEAEKAEKLKPKLTKLTSATYTTCQPNCHTWKVKGSTILLNTETGRGTAWNTRMLIHGFPIFYLPYFNFPIDKDRKTGLLNPSVGGSTKNGFIITQPFYWNIAPNYDATITPNYLTKRGLLLDGLFRYLTPYNEGHFAGAFLPADKEFKDFKEDAYLHWSKKPTFNELQKASNNRSGFSWQDNTKLNEHWSTKLNYNFVSDAYFIQDLGDNLIDNSETQLPRQLQINYADSIWNMDTNLQAYQTLHAVDLSDVSNQTAKLPQFHLNGTFPYHPLDHPFGLDFALKSEFVRFVFHRNPYTTNASVPLLDINTRISLRPSISLPLTLPFAFLTPQAQLQITKYNLQHPRTNFPKDPGIAIPLFNVKGGLFFDRTIKPFGHAYQQTLEPVIYYLYIPYRYQDKYPLFDTGTQTFSYNFMFLDNRFSGVDRVGDANQMAFGLTTRFIDEDTGEERLNAQIGQLHYFHNRDVTACYGTNCQVSAYDKQINSPIVTSVDYHFDPAWNITGGLTWDTIFNSVINRNLTLQYTPDPKRIITFDYTYGRQGDSLSGEPANSPRNSLGQTNVAGYWQLTQHWSIMGRWNFNWADINSKAYFYGISYDSCCWAIRFVRTRTFIGVNERHNDRYDYQYYLQFAFKGLGNVGTGDPSKFLNSTIGGGYLDTFGQET